MRGFQKTHYFRSLKRAALSTYVLLLDLDSSQVGNRRCTGPPILDHPSGKVLECLQIVVGCFLAQAVFLHPGDIPLHFRSGDICPHDEFAALGDTPDPRHRHLDLLASIALVEERLFEIRDMPK
ncbi:MAG: hypothetical protein ACYSWO_03725 [Planctomycetota bacterium]